MRTSDRGIMALIIHEGVVPGPYLDSVGVLTYGVGHTAAAGYPNPRDLPVGMPKDLDKELRKVFEVFRKDLVAYEREVLQHVKVPLKQHEFDALVSFHFNTGGISRAAITRHLNNGDRKAAARAFMNWSKPAEIIPRRREEQRLFATGQYPTGRATVWQVGENKRPIWRPIRTLSQEEIMHFMKTSEESASEVAIPVGGNKGLIGILIAIVVGAIALLGGN